MFYKVNIYFTKPPTRQTFLYMSIYLVTYLTKNNISAVDQNNYSLPLEVSWHEHQSQRQLQALRHHKPAGDLQTSSNRPGKFNESVKCVARPPALIQTRHCVLVLTAGCLIHVVSWWQVFVLMQFGRKKDWPHGKLILHNSAWRIKIFITSHNSNICGRFAGKEIPEYKDEPWEPIFLYFLQLWTIFM